MGLSEAFKSVSTVQVLFIFHYNIGPALSNESLFVAKRSDEFLESAINTTKNGGIIHYYSHIHADKKSDAGKLSEEHFLQISPIQSEILTSKIVRPVGPRYYQTVVDVKISK